MGNSKSSRKAPVLRAFTFSLKAMLFWAILQPAAQAIPPNQRDFDANTVRTSLGGALVPGTFVTVNNDVARACVIQFSADATSSGSDLVRVGYTVDSLNRLACVTTGGPATLAGDGTSVGGTVTWVRTIPRGLHTIRACYGIADIDGGGGQASLFDRSLTVECRTQ